MMMIMSIIIIIMEICKAPTPRLKALNKHNTHNVHRDEIQTQKASNERLFILTWTHSMQIFGKIPFIKPQNDT